MFDNTLVLSSSSHQGIQQLKHSGNAVVEKKKGPDTYLIRIGNDKLLIKTSPNSLQEGEKIQYQIQNKHLIIQKENQNFSRKPTQDSDTFCLEHSNKFNSVKAITNSLIEQLENNNKPSQIIIKEIESILNSFKSVFEKIDPETLRKITTFIDNLKNQTATESDKSQLIKLLEKIEIKCEKMIHTPETKGCKLIGIIEKFIPEGIYRFSSDSKIINFLDMFPETKLDYFTDKNTPLFFKAITAQDNTTIIVALDSEELFKEFISLKSLFSSLVMKSIPPQVYEKLLNEREQIQFSTLNKLDNLFLFNNLNIPAKRAGSQAAQIESLTQWLRTVLDYNAIADTLVQRCPFASSSSIATSAKESQNILPDIEQKIPCITNQLLKGYSDKAGLFSDIAEKLGFNYERKILESSNTILSKQDSDYSNSFNLKKFLLSLITENNLSSGGINLSADFHKDLSISVSRFCGIVENTIKYAENKINEQVNTGNNLTIQTQTTSSINQIDALRKKITESFSAISNLLDRENVSNKNDIQNSLPGLLSLIKNEAVKLNTAVSEIIKLLSSEINSSNVLYPERNGTFNFLRNPDGTIMEKIHQMQESLKELKSILKQVDTLNDSNNRIYSSDSIKTQHGSLSYPLLLRDSAESFLTRLESLQLLARNTHTQEGDQQILALPIKISDEWTEVNIRLVKKKAQKNQKNKNRQYSVYLNVSPGHLGSISIKMDYTVKKTLKLEMEFEQKKVKNWFYGKKELFFDKLQDLGFSSVQFHISSQKQREEQVPGADLPLRGDIDLKI